MNLKYLRKKENSMKKENPEKITRHGDDGIRYFDLHPIYVKILEKTI